MLLAPLHLAVAALLPVRRIILELSPVIVSPPSTLALTPATNNLVRMIPGGIEQLSTVRATGTPHTHSSHGDADLTVSLFQQLRRNQIVLVFIKHIVLTWYVN
jgi:hypothetical protein